MRKSDRAALEVLFPRVRASVLRLLIGSPQRRFHVRDLMRRTGFALSTVQDELRKLAALGLVSSWSNHYHRFYSANTSHSLFEPLFRIVRVSDRLPSTDCSILYGARRRSKKKPARPVYDLSRNNPMNWGILKKH